jgi:PKD repeat protein
MKQKKTYSILIMGMMLVSLLLIVVPVSAGELHTVRGHVYLDNVRAPAGTEVKISFFTGDEPPSNGPPELTSNTGHYQIDFQGHEWDIGEFHVIYNAVDYIPVDNQSVEISSGIIGYEFDLHVNTTSGGENNEGNENTGGNNGGSTGNSGYQGLSPTIPAADANGPYYGYLINGIAKVTFDGSGCSGLITSYSWVFGDGKTGTGISPTHNYSTLGFYTVNLTVTGPEGSDFDKTFVVISDVPNNPPTTPVVSGPQKGSKNIDYDYTAISTDYDNDSIQYLFDWGDGSNVTSNFSANGKAVTVSHNWSAWGIYTISVKAYDNKTLSDIREYDVLIDVIYVKDIGYLIDKDSNGSYTLFHSNEIGSNIATEKQTNGTYLIDSDGSAGWDWIYDPVTNTLTNYNSEEGENSGAAGKPAGNLMWYLLVALLLIIILLLVLFTFTTKKKGKQKSKK